MHHLPGPPSEPFFVSPARTARPGAARGAPPVQTTSCRARGIAPDDAPNKTGPDGRLVTRKHPLERPASASAWPTSSRTLYRRAHRHTPVVGPAPEPSSASFLGRRTQQDSLAMPRRVPRGPRRDARGDEPHLPDVPPCPTLVHPKAPTGAPLSKTILKKINKRRYTSSSTTSKTTMSIQPCSFFLPTLASDRCVSIRCVEVFHG